MLFERLRGERFRIPAAGEPETRDEQSLVGAKPSIRAERIRDAAASVAKLRDLYRRMDEESDQHGRQHGRGGFRDPWQQEPLADQLANLRDDLRRVLFGLPCQVV